MRLFALPVCISCPTPVAGFIDIKTSHIQTVQSDAHTRTHTHTHARTYTHAHTHTHTHTHTRRLVQPSAQSNGSPVTPSLLVPLCDPSPHHTSLSPKVTTGLLSIFSHFVFPRILYRWNHTACSLFTLTPFPQPN